MLKDDYPKLGGAATDRRYGQGLHDEEKLLKFDGKEPTSASMSSFPNELLEEIFSNFPVRTLTQFKCVCKSWRDLISSKDFINLHLKNYKTTNILLNSKSGEERLISPVYPLDTPPEVRSTVDFTIPDYISHNVAGYDYRPWMTASCNGLICIWDYHDIDSIALWNPATKDLKKIPKSNVHRQSKFVHCRVLFGYDDVRNDYKLIRALCGDEEDGDTQFELYSLNTGLWKRLDTGPLIKFPLSIPFGSLSTGERIVCWLAKFVTEMDERRWELVLFDMSTERFEIVQVPLQVSKCRNLELIPYEGSIGVINLFSNDESWALNDIYSESGELRSWTKVKLPTVPPSRFLTRIVACWGDYVLYHNFKTNLLTLYDHRCQTFKIVDGPMQHNYLFTATRYKESLVRLL